MSINSELVLQDNDNRALYGAGLLGELQDLTGELITSKNDNSPVFFRCVWMEYVPTETEHVNPEDILVDQVPSLKVQACLDVERGYKWEFSLERLSEGGLSPEQILVIVALASQRDRIVEVYDE